MTLAVSFPIEPMEAEPVDELPGDKGWLFEPKYDGFRCIVFRDGDLVRLQSKRQKPLERFFPEVAQGLTALAVDRFVLDGELVIADGSFDDLQLRLHPAASRIAKLSQETPARLVAFDLLADGEGRSLMRRPLAERRAALEAFIKQAGRNAFLTLSKATRSRARAWGWITAGGLEGVMAKRLDLPYQSGERPMLKVKQWQTVDCVLAGLYLKPGTHDVDSLLLGLYDHEGKLNYVGRSTVQRATEAREFGKLFAPLIGGPGFTGRAPGGKSRWSERERKPIPLRPEIVLEVSFDHLTNDHMRHGSRLLRVRDDKKPADCSMDQIRRRRT